MAAAADDITVTVVAGYLGAGKTTLINHLLRVGTGRRTLVVVNDFGAINIDEDLIIERDGGTIALGNGCVCCTTSGTLAQMLLGIGARPDRPEHVVLEASGVSDPTPITRDVVDAGLALGGVVVVADAETVRERADHGYLGASVRRQIAAADVVVLNKVDLVDSGQLDELHGWLDATAPGAVVVDAIDGAVDPAGLLSTAESSRRSGSVTGDGAAPVALGAHAEHVSWSWTSDDPLERAALERWVDSLDEAVVRVKGLVRLAEAPDGWWVLQAVGPRWSLAPTTEFAAASRSSRLVVVALPGGAPPLPWPHGPES